jgi:hypothetical protein
MLKKVGPDTPRLLRALAASCGVAKSGAAPPTVKEPLNGCAVAMIFQKQSAKNKPVVLCIEILLLGVWFREVLIFKTCPNISSA